MRKILLICLIFSLSISSELPHDWPMFMHDSQRTGSALCAAPDTAYLLWEHDTGVPIAASPVVIDSTVFLAAKGKMIALQADTGDIIWEREVSVIGSTPAVSENVILVGTLTGFVALDSKTGKLLWEQQIWESYYYPYKEFFVSSPLIVEKRVYVGTGTNLQPEPLLPHTEEENLREPLRYIICMDIDSGEILWKTYLNGYADSSPAFKDDVLYINAASCYSLNPEDGDVYWRFDHGHLMSESPVVINDLIIMAAKSNYREFEVFCIQKEDILWKREFKGNIGSTSAVSQGKVVIITIEGDLSVLDLESGNKIWTEELGGEYLMKYEFIDAPPCSPAIADKKIYVGTENGLCSCIDLDTGKILWQYQTEGAILASPAISYEKVYMASTDGKLYCFGIDPETYFQKAENYEEQGNTEKAQDFYRRAREYYELQGNAEMVKECGEKLEEKSFVQIFALIGFFILIFILLGYLKMHKTSEG